MSVHLDFVPKDWNSENSGSRSCRSKLYDCSECLSHCPNNEVDPASFFIQSHPVPSSYFSLHPTWVLHFPWSSAQPFWAVWRASSFLFHQQKTSFDPVQSLQMYSKYKWNTCKPKKWKGITFLCRFMENICIVCKNVVINAVKEITHHPQSNYFSKLLSIKWLSKEVTWRQK